MKSGTWGVEKAVPALMTAGFFIHLINFCRTLAIPGASATDIMLWPVDFVLFLIMVYTAVTLLLRYRAVSASFDLHRTWRRVGYWILTVYIWISVPFHILYLTTGNADIITKAPWWFSGAILPVYVVIFAYFFTLKPRADTALRGMTTIGA